MTGIDDSIADEIPKRYSQLSRLGAGGVGVVFKAHDSYLDKPVAIKMLLVDAMSNDMVTRFQREAKTASLLNHPYIISILDFGLTQSGKPYMVMEFVEGKTLDTIIDERESLTVEESLPIFNQLCEGLSHAHQRGILHRDLKPSNVIVTKTESAIPVVKILDFGLAKLEGITGEKTLTQAGAVLGSPLFMSPEQALGKIVDLRSDMYSVGVLMFQTLTGRVPIKGDTALETLSLKSMQPAPRMDAAKFPAELCDIVDRCLQINPEDRFQTIDALETALAQVGAQSHRDENLHTRSIVMTPHSVPKRKAARKAILLQLATLGAAVGVGVIIFSKQALIPTKSTATSKTHSDSFSDVDNPKDIHEPSNRAGSRELSKTRNDRIATSQNRMEKYISAGMAMRAKKIVTFKEALRLCDFNFNDKPTTKIEKLERFVNSDKFCGGAYLELARQYWIIGKQDRSMAYMDLLLSFTGYKKNVVDTLDRYLYKKGQYADSLKRLNECGSKYKDLPYIKVCCLIRSSEDSLRLGNLAQASSYIVEAGIEAPDKQYREYVDLMKEAINNEMRKRHARLPNP